MGDNKISDERLRSAQERIDSYHLQGEAVPVAFTSETQLTALRESGDGLMGPKGKRWNIPLYTHPQPAELSEVSGNSGELCEQQGDALRIFACEAVEYFRERADVVDGDYGSPSPNEEMKLLSEGKAALAATGNQQVGEVQEPVLYQIREEIIGKDSLGSTNLKVKEKLNSWREISKSHYDAYVSVMGGRGPMGVLGHPDGPVALELNRYNPKVEVRALYAAPPAQGIELSPIAARKLGVLAAQGYVTNGVAIFNPATGHRGLVDNLGFVGWMGAQGVELGQFRSAVEGWRESLDRVVADTNATHPARRVAAGRVGEAIRLLALIDQRDAGAGAS